MKKGVKKSVKKTVTKSAPVEEKEETEPVQAEDWLGDDDVSGIGSDEEGEEASEAEEDSDEEGEEDDDDDEEIVDEIDEDEAAKQLAPLDDDAVDDDTAGAFSVGGKSKILDRVAAGTHSGDLNAIKQKIADDVFLLSNWRKAKELGNTRSRDEVFSGLVHNCSTYYGYSEELAEYFLQLFNPEEAIKFFDANETHRPLTIRTNSMKARRSTLMQALQARKVNLDPVGEWTKVGLKVYDSQVPVGATPEYLGGQYMIQSASSFIPVMALAPQQNEVVLDMAAAPGGKTTYLGQLMRNTGTLFANDLRKDRCKSLVANVHRMGLTNVIVTNLDGKDLKGKLPRLDRVLLDAPCTGVGIIARDPSVKVKRGVKDFEEHSSLQKELLMSAIDMIDAKSKTGGYVVYSTCSVSVEENESVIDHILKVRNVELVSFKSSVDFGVEGLTKYREKRFHPSLNLTRRYYPHVHNMDGFYVAKLKKTSNDIPERAKKDRTRGTEHIKNWGEEHWTEDMMNTVMDFTDEAENTDNGPKEGKGNALNKRDRKKLKRAHLQPKEEKAAAADGKKKLKKRKQPESADAEASVTEPSKKKAKKETGEAAAAAAEAPAKKKKVLKKKSVKPSEPEETPKPAAPVSSVSAPTKKKKKKAPSAASK